MLRPNSPRPPSGTTSTGGAPADDRLRLGHTHAKSQPDVRAPERPARPGKAHRQPIEPGRVRKVAVQAAGSACKTRRVFVGNYSTASLYGRDEDAARKRGQFRPARASRAAASDRCPPPSAPGQRPSPRLRRERLQGVGDGLPPLREHGPHHADEGRRVVEVAPSAAGTSAGRRRNAPSAAAETRRAAATGPASRRHAARSARSARRSRRCRPSPPGDPRLPSAASASRRGRRRSGGELEQPEQDRRRDVVGKVADDANLIRRSRRRRPATPSGSAPGRRQHVAGDDRDVRQACGFESAARSRSTSIASSRSRLRGQRPGDGATAGADLDDRVVRRRRRRRRPAC